MHQPNNTHSEKKQFWAQLVTQPRTKYTKNTNTNDTNRREH